MDDKAGEAEAPISNLQRLRGHLKDGGLAARLVDAYMNPGKAAPGEALKKVMTDRLEELRHSHAVPADKES